MGVGGRGRRGVFQLFISVAGVFLFHIVNMVMHMLVQSTFTTTMAKASSASFKRIPISVDP